MNIKEAKIQIQNAMKAYFTKDAHGNYIIPIERQRPIFLLGAPGIGKTAIMEQVASELGVGLVAYSMTHHTRQSALGLPFIQRKTYGGKEYDVSEYTMSEIIASVYDMMEQTGVKEGILFLDEINCVSETLAPSMLQFLQYKIFGKHRVPDGWIVVTAGNPPEYNNSVREFDIVTWDRLKRIDVEADYSVWKEYAYAKGTHASIMSYLEIKKGDFYKIETTVDGKSFVTARGWSDLSDMIKLYEMHGITVDEMLIAQYLQNKRIAKDFAVYYDLFNKYKSDYQIDQILNGKASAEIKNRAKSARFDERLALLGLMIDGIALELRNLYEHEKTILQLRQLLPSINQTWKTKQNTDFSATIDRQIKDIHGIIEKGKQASSLSPENISVYYQTISFFEEVNKLFLDQQPEKPVEAAALLKLLFENQLKALKKSAKSVGAKMSNIFKFCNEVFPDGNELLILVTELTINRYSAHFVSRYGCDEYYANNKELLFYDRHKEIVRELDSLDLNLNFDD
ncbi:MAG: AAA family ATPase [Clostridia bacterium]|nr:AAA family ATPase [Clostridia bacterium]